jgi:hypothetical protein
MEIQQHRLQDWSVTLRRDRLFFNRLPLSDHSTVLPTMLPTLLHTKNVYIGDTRTLHFNVDRGANVGLVVQDPMYSLEFDV